MELSLIESLASPYMISLSNMSNVSADTESSYLLNSLPQLRPLLFSAVQNNCPRVKSILNTSSLFLRSVNIHGKFSWPKTLLRELTSRG